LPGAVATIADPASAQIDGYIAEVGPAPELGRLREGKMQTNRRSRRAVAVIAVAGFVVAGCGSSGGAKSTGTTTGSTGSTTGGSTNTASAPGVTATTITVGLITSLSGAASPEYTGIIPAAQARIDQMNAAGGVNGRQIKLVTADDSSSPTNAATAAQVLVSKNVFAVIGESPFIFGGAQYLNKQAVPVVGGGYDGPEWGTKPFTNMFALMPVDPHYPVNDGAARFVKQQGGSVTSAFGYGQSPSSTAAAKGFILAATKNGLKNGYLNTSIPFGSVATTPIALAMKQANVDSAYLPMDNNTNFALVTAAKQARVNLKVAVSATGYGQSLLDDASAVQAANGSYFLSLAAPVEINNAATKNFQSGLAQYAHFTGIPGFDYQQGWMAADLLIKGLEVAGQNPTRTSFETGLQGVSNYNAGGLLPTPDNFAVSQFGQLPQTQCSYYLQLRGTTFVPVPANGQPFCGQLLPNSNQL
jgi:branched-chain amino acid transport system substrate-binding protein